MINSSHGNSATPCITDEFAIALKKFRASYNYPKAFIERADARSYDIELAKDFYASYRVPQQNQATDKWLDSYHHSLLKSNDAQDQLLGLASVVYWGFYTFGDNYSRVRVFLLINGYGRYPPTVANNAAERINAMSNFLDHGDAGAALGTLSGISQLNRTPFASKVVAFLAPSVAGVYDNRIQAGLSNEKWAGHINSGVGAVSSPSIKKSYQSWCVFLSLVSSQLNCGIGSGKEWSWSCGQDWKQSWRALDVERALFAKFDK
jgi:hypothetical protein